ncbi:MAG: N-acetylmuramoyl-L-alanine amidase [Desulfovermiculus sp.]|nr:N-acetylmuramoyl-L-alanine amidase [Desulfovermiculus sp.]
MPLLRYPLLAQFILVLCLLCTPALGADPTQEFQAGWQAFHDLCKDPAKAKYRSSWQQVANHFQKAYQANPKGSVAPKSLYYLGRTFQELGKRSFSREDYEQAVEYFRRLGDQFSSHSWTDDAKLFQAKVFLHNLDDPEQAYLLLSDIRRNHPKGDKTSEAEALLEKLEGKYPSQISSWKASSQGEGREDGKQSTTSDPAHLQTIRHWSSDEYSRVVLDLNSQAGYKDMLLKPDPSIEKPFYRVVVDVLNTRLDDEVQEKLSINDGILRKVRIGQYRPNQTRVVLDVNALDTYRVFALENPDRVVVDVYAPKPSEGEQKSRKALAQAAKEGGQSISGSLIEQLGLDIQTIMIDPGHGGKDPGAVCSGILEKDINLRLAKILGEILEEKGYNVLYTRTTDTFIPLEERTAMANAKSVDLFLSLHVNAHSSSKIHGLEVYYLNLANSEEAVRVAARENSVSAKKISDLQLILSDLMLNSKIEESENLAQKVLHATLDYNRRFYKVNDHGVRRAPFYVLMGARMPAILVETGYLTNPTERKRLQNFAYLKRMAWGMALGIKAYHKEITSFAQR